jgi:hypothetical protein
MKIMGKSISRTRKRGRPRTGAESIHLRLLPDQLRALDIWIARRKRDQPGLTRPEAIRRLIEFSLSGYRQIDAMDAELISRVIAWAAANKVSRAEVFIRLVERGLASPTRR